MQAFYSTLIKKYEKIGSNRERESYQTVSFCWLNLSRTGEKNPHTGPVVW